MFLPALNMVGLHFSMLISLGQRLICYEDQVACHEDQVEIAQVDGTESPQTFVDYVALFSGNIDKDVIM